jgi:precorrin-6A/cobalt-precorrin-6A reductase
VTRPILILGGTSEGREAAGQLVAAGIPVISSLAGRVSNPRLPAGEVRIGGFGGPDAFGRWLVEQRIAGVLDATHPFAERISASALAAGEAAGVPVLRLERPGWRAAAGDRWSWVDDLPAAAARIVELGATRVLLTTGRQGLAAFASVQTAWFLVRCVDEPAGPLPARHSVLLDRGPFTLAGELALIDGHAIDLVVTKDSGGSMTDAKLAAARNRGLRVVVVRRPRTRAAAVTVISVADAVAWAASLAAAGSVDPDGGAERHQVAQLEHRRVLDAHAAVRRPAGDQ